MAEARKRHVINNINVVYFTNYLNLCRLFYGFYQKLETSGKNIFTWQCCKDQSRFLQFIVINFGKNRFKK
jgi:hypothetical protein